MNTCSSITNIETKNIDTFQLDEYLTNELKVIQSHGLPDSSSTEKAIKQAKIVFLLERHEINGGQEQNGWILSHFWTKGDHLLTEGDYRKFIGNPDAFSEKIQKNILKTSSAWDIGEDPYHDKLNLELHNFVEVAKRLPGYVFYTLQTEDFLKVSINNVVILKDKILGGDEPAEIQKQDREQRLSFLRKLCLNASRRIEDKIQQIDRHIQNNFFKQQNSLIKHVRECADKPGKVWVILGEAHGRYVQPDKSEAVKNLYQQVEKYPHISLRYRSTKGKMSERERAGLSLNTPEQAEKKHKKFMKDRTVENMSSVVQKDIEKLHSFEDQYVRIEQCFNELLAIEEEHHFDYMLYQKAVFSIAALRIAAGWKA